MAATAINAQATWDGSELDVEYGTLVTPAPPSYTPPNGDVYVATTGSDTTGTGTIGSPWRTVAFALNNIARGTDINVAAGTYSASTDGWVITRNHYSAWGGEPTATHRIRIIGPGVEGVADGSQAKFTNLIGVSYPAPRPTGQTSTVHGCYVHMVPYVEHHGLHFIGNVSHNMLLRVQGEYNIYRTQDGRFIYRGKDIYGIVIDDCYFEKSGQTLVNIRGNLVDFRVNNCTFREAGMDGGFIGEGLYCGTEPKLRDTSDTRGYDQAVAAGVNMAALTSWIEVDFTRAGFLTNNDIDVDWSPGPNKSECIELKPLTGIVPTALAASGPTAYAFGTGLLIEGAAYTYQYVTIDGNLLEGAGQNHVLCKGYGHVTNNVIGVGSTHMSTSADRGPINVGRQAYQGGDAGGWEVRTGDRGMVRGNTIDNSHDYEILWDGDFNPVGQQFQWCGNSPLSSNVRVVDSGWVNGWAQNGGTAGAVTNEFGDPSAAC